VCKSEDLDLLYSPKLRYGSGDSMAEDDELLDFILELK
jgi:hypothetical protein